MRRKLVRRAVAATTVWVFTLPVSAAPAEGVHVAPVSVEGASEEHVVAALEAAVGSGLSDAGVAVLPAPAGCTKAECMVEATTAGNARGVVVASVQVSGSDYQLAAEIRGPGGATIAAEREACEICTYEEASVAMRELVAKTARAMPTAAVEESPPDATTGHVRITSSPAGATVVIDNVTVGTTPYDAELTPGRHRVEIQKAGHESQLREVDVAAGDDATVELELRRKGGTLSPRTTEIIGWSAIGVGAASLVSGIALLVLDNNAVKSNCSGANVDGDGDCLYRYDTLNGGVALTVVGVALAATGVGLVVYVRKNKKREPSNVALVPGGLRARF